MLARETSAESCALSAASCAMLVSMRRGALPPTSWSPSACTCSLVSSCMISSSVPKSGGTGVVVIVSRLMDSLDPSHAACKGLSPAFGLVEVSKGTMTARGATSLTRRKMCWYGQAYLLVGPRYRDCEVLLDEPEAVEGIARSARSAAETSFGSQKGFYCEKTIVFVPLYRCPTARLLPLRLYCQALAETHRYSCFGSD